LNYSQILADAHCVEQLTKPALKLGLINIRVTVGFKAKIIRFMNKSGKKHWATNLPQLIKVI